MENLSVKRKAFGFTLMELLVVIAIIALLLSILMPSLRRVRDQAKQTQCVSNCKQWATAINTYVSDNEDYYPARFWPNMPTGIRYTVWSWPHMYYKTDDTDLLSIFIEPYLGEQKYTWCPYYPANADSHEPYEKQKDKPGRIRNWVIGDLGMFVGYPSKAVPGVRGCVCTWPGLEPPEKAQFAPSRMAVAGDMVREADSGYPDRPWTYSHPHAPGVSDKPKGMCAAFADLSAKWTSFRDMTPHSNIEQLSYRYYWPDPMK